MSPIPSIDAVIIRPQKHPKPTLEETKVTDYKDYGAAVEGYIEAVSLELPIRLTEPPHNGPNPHRRIPFIMWVNEEYLYKFKVQDWNFVATSVAGTSGRPDLLLQGILGPALVTGPADEEGETTSIPDKITVFLRHTHMQIETDITGITETPLNEL